MTKVLTAVGLGLLVLGGISGFALFIRAVTGSGDKEGTGTLWGLFFLCLLAGLGILAALNVP